MLRGRLHGITLVELLVAGVVLAVLLLIVGQLFGSSFRSYAVTEAVGERRQITQSAVELIRYDLSLAGYRCVDSDSGTRSFSSSPFAFTPATTTGGSTTPATVTVRYFEDRFTGGTCTGPVVVSYASADGAMTRSVGGASPVPVVEGVTSMTVESWLNVVNSQFVQTQRPADSQLAGAVLRLAFVDGIDEVFTVGFRNSQCADLTSCE